MKKKFIYVFFALSGLFLSSCDDYTDLEPKGKNMLATIEQIEMLLNDDFDDYGLQGGSDELLIGNAYSVSENIANIISQPQQSLDKILLTWDESADRSDYTASDSRYTAFYRIIGKIANPVLSRIDDAEGDATKKAQLKAEALILRAWFGYLAVCHYAKAYNSSTASTDGGVPYQLETDDTATPCVQYTVKEVYDLINKDIDTALSLNSLPDKNINQMRVSKAFAYAVKAMVAMSMHDYDTAYQAAQQSLSINNTVSDYNNYVVDKMGMNYLTGEFSAYKELQRPYLSMEEDLFFTYDSSAFIGFAPNITAAFEDGNVFHAYYPSDINAFGFSYLAMQCGLDIECWYYSTDFSFSKYGLRTTDMLLILAEIDIRKGNIDEAMAQLDKIRACRLMPEYYTSLAGTVTSKADAIKKFKQIATIENFCTSKNYLNIKRWNTENNEWTETITRNLFGVEYTLRPDSKLWIWPFPQNETSLNPNIKQNY